MAATASPQSIGLEGRSNTDLTDAVGHVESDPVALRLADDVTIAAPKPIREMTTDDHAEFGRQLREAALRSDSDETEAQS